MSRIFPIISVAILLLIITGAVFLWWPKYQSFRAISQDLEVKTEQLRQKQEYFLKLNNLKAEIQNYQEEIAKINAALPEDFSFTDMFNYVMNVVSENGLVLRQLGAARIPSQGQAAGTEEQSVPLSFSVSGSYESLKNLLSALYQNARLINVKAIALTPPEGEEQMFGFDLSLSTNYYPKVSESPASAESQQQDKAPQAPQK